MKRLNRHSRRARRGFTLLELLLVLAILGILAAMVVPQFFGQQRQAYIKTCKASMHGLETALKLYAVAHDGEFPSGNTEALQQLLSPTDSQGKPMEPYIDKIPLDPWGQPFQYEYPNTRAKTASKPAIWSSGPDRKNDNGANDDVNNWLD